MHNEKSGGMHMLPAEIVEVFPDMHYQKIQMFFAAVVKDLR